MLVSELGQAIEGKTDTDDQLAAVEQELGEARGRIDAAMPLARQVAQDLAALVAEVGVVLTAMQLEAAAGAAGGGADSAAGSLSGVRLRPVSSMKASGQWLIIK